MKLLVIVLCLLSERFFIHASSHYRFHWFSIYGKAMEKRFSNVKVLSSAWLMLFVAVFPMLLAMSVLLFLLSNGLFGFIGLILNVIIFYCSLGPGNPFYPVRVSTADDASSDEIKNYLSSVNGQLFAVIFWYILFGPLAALGYRLISLCQEQPSVQKQALRCTQTLDWLPTRLTALLYLIVGNFQAGVRDFAHLFFSDPSSNRALLSSCGLEALAGVEPLTMPSAERLVEHAVIALLVLLACFTLVAWM